MTLATATRDGRPSARMVLLKGADQRGFVFYTNYESQKGDELDENPRAALVLYWAALGRQVRIAGGVTPMSKQESDAYFQSRPIESRLSAWASRQSTVIPNREVLEERMRRLRDQYRDRSVPLPPYWGGYRVDPETIEFWLHRESRLHDRLRYTRQADGRWRLERLSP